MVPHSRPRVSTPISINWCRDPINQFGLERLHSPPRSNPRSHRGLPPISQGFGLSFQDITEVDCLSIEGTIETIHSKGTHNTVRIAVSEWFTAFEAFAAFVLQTLEVEPSKLELSKRGKTGIGKTISFLFR